MKKVLIKKILIILIKKETMKEVFKLVLIDLAEALFMMKMLLKNNQYNFNLKKHFLIGKQVLLVWFLPDLLKTHTEKNLNK
jgi:hypothetical protein